MRLLVEIVIIGHYFLWMGHATVETGAAGQHDSTNVPALQTGDTFEYDHHPSSHARRVREETLGKGAVRKLSTGDRRALAP